jgi:multidrug efflux pump subunit AcrB
MVERMLRRSGRFLLLYGLLAAVMVFVFLRVPSSFLPDEDQGVMFTIVQTPVGATQQRTQKVMEQVERHYLENESEHVVSTFRCRASASPAAARTTAWSSSS